MSELFEDLEGLAPDEGFLVLEEVFHLEDQLAAVDDTGRAATKGDELR
jgi:L-rhamnose mutarotase